MRLRIAVFTVLMTLAAWATLVAPPIMLGDGSDPMPLCRHRRCK